MSELNLQSSTDPDERGARIKEFRDNPGGCGCPL